MPNHKHQRGFTLVELIMVIVVMGIIAGMVSVYMKSPIDAYVASGRRAAMTDVADTVVRRMARDIQRALPNSIRTPTTTSTNLCVEFIPTKTGGRYRTEGSGALDFAGTTTSGSFNMLGSNTLFAGNTIPIDQQIAKDDVIVVYNLGIPGSDAYELSNTAVSGVPSVAVSSPAETAIGITYSPGLTHFPLASGSNRFHVVPAGENIVAYVCDLTAHELRRTVRTFAGTTSCLATGPILASNVSSCNFDYSGSDLKRNALISMRLAFTDSGETVTLQHEVHVSNTP